MPVVNPGAKVLVTGVNGFVATWLAKHLLEKGYSVRGTVRSIQRSGDYIKDYFKSYGDRFELVEISDFTKPGVFDDAVQGVEAIEHVATPADFTIVDPQDYIRPAVDGTLSILDSALKHGSTLKRFIYLSSAVTIGGAVPPAQPTTFTDKDWYDQALEEVESLGKDADPATKYTASKIRAERAAWDFVSKNKDKITWDLTTLHPPMVFGPVAHEVPSADKLNFSTKTWWGSVVEPGPQSKEAAAHFSAPWIDVRDLADALILAVEKEAAGGERLIVSSGTFVWQDFVNAASSLNPSPLPSRKVPVGYPEEAPKYTYFVDVSKAERILGIKYRTIKETTKDIFADFAAKGW